MTLKPDVFRAPGEKTPQCLVRKIEDRGVSSLFDCKENYNGSIILLQERGDIQAQISHLFNVGFLMWRWKVNLVFR